MKNENGKMKNEKYLLRCLECGKTISDRYTNICPESHDSLLRTEYKTKEIRKLSGKGMFNYIDWLPIEEALPINASPITYKSEDFGKELGLKNCISVLAVTGPKKELS